MLERIAVILIVALALAIVGRFVYRKLTGKDASCGACPKGCGSCAPDHTHTSARDDRVPSARQA